MKIGTCGFCESRKRIFSDFNAVELQNTFYDFVKNDWLEKLKREAPESFEFTIKGIQVITHTFRSPTYRRFKSEFGRKENYGHFRDTYEVRYAMEKMVEYASILGARIIILQSPPDFSESEENVRNMVNFFSSFSSSSITLGWEPRGKWNEKTILEILSNFNAVHVVDPFKSRSIYGKFKYYRLHGKGGYSYNYGQDDLSFLRGVAHENDYVMFNNTHMCQNAKTFREMVEHEIKDTGQGNPVR